MAIRLSGTFEDTGNSGEITASLINIDLTFVGTATVNLQWCLDGNNWRTVETYTGSEQIVFEASRVPVRLNCSAHTDDVSYAMMGVA